MASSRSRPTKCSTANAAMRRTVLWRTWSVIRKALGVHQLDSVFCRRDLLRPGVGVGAGGKSTTPPTDAGRAESGRARLAGRLRGGCSSSTSPRPAFPPGSVRRLVGAGGAGRGDRQPVGTGAIALALYQPECIQTHDRHPHRFAALDAHLGLQVGHGSPGPVLDGVIGEHEQDPAVVGQLLDKRADKRATGRIGPQSDTAAS